jgi:hypothetical protein
MLLQWVYAYQSDQSPHSMPSAVPPHIATYGFSEGQCNICGEVGPLTFDHTPPKGVLKLRQVELRHLTDRHKGRAFQNGVAYRTLCQRCNNELGAFSDPALIDFANAVGHALQSEIIQLTVRCDVQAVMRAVVGHLSAVGVDRYLKGDATEPIARYVTDRTQPLPANLKIFWWPFPFQGQVMMRDAAMTHTPTHEIIAFWMLKFFPVAFFVAIGAPDSVRFRVPELSANRSVLPGVFTDLPIDLSTIVHPFWPEAPSREHFLMVGRDAMAAHPFQRREKNTETSSEPQRSGTAAPVITKA